MRSRWVNKQWKVPVQYLYKGWGLTVWKWCGFWFPTWNIWFGGAGMNHIGYDIFHSGAGFTLMLEPVIIVQICTSGKFAWWNKRGKFRLSLFKKEIIVD